MGDTKRPPLEGVRVWRNGIKRKNRSEPGSEGR